MDHRTLTTLLVMTFAVVGCVEVDRVKPSTAGVVDANPSDAPSDGSASDVVNTELASDALDAVDGATDVVDDGAQDGDGGPDADSIADALEDAVASDVDAEVASDAPGDSDATAPECVADEDCAHTPCQSATCQEGVCLVETSIAPGEPCDDGIVCTVVTVCDEEAQCSGFLKDGFCDDDDPCTHDICSGFETTGGEDNGCLHSPLEDGMECDDGTVCTVDTTCVGGACVGEEILCDDEDPCTVDDCDAGTGCTVDTAVDGTPCEDDDPCTVDETCVSGECGWSALDCDDENPCTQTSCDSETGCVTQNLSADTPCDAGNICTFDDACDGSGLCVLGELLIPGECDDANPCTLDGCAPSGAASKGACTHEAQAGACDDLDPCTNVDQCVLGECKGSEILEFVESPGDPPQCDDGEACSLDECVANVGCVHTPLDAAPCEDGSLCTANDSCTKGECVSGPPPDCTNENACIDGSCEPDVGCVTENLLGDACLLAEPDGACVLPRCDGAGDCGVLLQGGELSESEGQLTDVLALPDGGWALVGFVAADEPQAGSSCAIVTRLDDATQVLWQVTPTCDGGPTSISSQAHGLDRLPDGRLVVVGSVDSDIEDADELPHLWVLDDDGGEVTGHLLGSGALNRAAWDVRVRVEGSVIVLMEHALDASGASRAHVAEVHPTTDWMTSGVESSWSVVYPDSDLNSESLQARHLLSVGDDTTALGLIGSYALAAGITKQTLAIFATDEDDPQSVETQIAYSELGVQVAANDATYWADAPGESAFLIAGSAMYDADGLWSQLNVVNGNSKLIGAYGAANERNRSVVFVDGLRVVVAAQHEDGYGLVRLLGLDGVTEQPLSEDGVQGVGWKLGPEEQAVKLEFGPDTAVHGLACQVSAPCLAVGSRSGEPAWFVFHATVDDTLEPCGL